jgi:phosphatidylglycerophosphatase C
MPPETSQEAPAIPRLPLSALLARLDAHLTGPGRLPAAVLASDADGTLWDGDVGVDLFEALLAERAFREPAREALAGEARAVGLPAGGDANDLARALYDAHLAGRYESEPAFAMMAWACAGYRRGELRAVCDRVLDARGFEARVRPALRAVLRWAGERGVEVYVVSASPLEMVLAATARLGIAPERVAAMTPAAGVDGALLARLDGPVVYGEGKLAALEIVRPGARASLLAAFGDSAYDAALLRAARVPVAVTPSPALVALARAIDGIVELDRGP